MGLHCHMWSFSSCGKQWLLFCGAQVVGLWASVFAACGLSSAGSSVGSVVVVWGPSCSMACGIFPEQGWNPCPLHWQVDSSPLDHQGNPKKTSLKRRYYWIRSFKILERSFSNKNFDYIMAQIKD